MKNPLRPLYRDQFGGANTLVLESLDAAWRPLQAGATKLREEFGDHARAELLEGLAAELLDWTENVLSQVEEDAGEPDRCPSLEEEFAGVWQDYLQWRASEWSARGEDSYGTKRRFGHLLRNILLECTVGIQTRRDVTDDELIAAAQDAWKSRSR